MRSTTAGILLLVVVLSACAGMQGAAPGGPAPDFAHGVLTKSFDRGVLGTYEASVKAMTDLGMTIRRSDKDAAGGFIEATRPDDMEQVLVRFKSEGQDATTAAIRIGSKGDEPYSRIVVRRIEARLKG